MKKLIYFFVMTVVILIFSGSVFAQVTQQWAARYNGPGNGVDEAHSLAVDGSGNVYVTGFSMGSGTGYDYATIKYNSAGIVQWIATYNGPGNGDDNATAITLDGSGNVYVTGSSMGSGTSYDYATIKYNSSGIVQWISRYNGQGNNEDYAKSITVDGSGNVFVTGNSTGNGTGFDYATIKYDNSTGAVQWISMYNGPGNTSDVAYSLAVDGSGNVYVTGSSMGSGTLNDYATIKYDNSTGAVQWISRYNGPGNDNDDAYSLAVDGSGNVYVTGSSLGSGTSSDYATIKYNSSGIVQWISRYNGPGNGADNGKSVALDGLGNVYVTGNSIGSGTSDYATIKYDNSTGAAQWVSRYNGPGNTSDFANSLAVDGSDNVYVTGYSTGTGTLFDYATIKYNSSGIEQWVARYNGPGNGDDFANSLKLDGLGNVFVTGYSMGSGTGFDYATIKYSQFCQLNVSAGSDTTIY